MPTAQPPKPFLAHAKLWYGRQSRVARITVWLLGIFAISFVFGFILGILRGIAVFLLLVSALPLVICLLILFWRWFTRRVLWSVRNRLTVTYLLMGLAPIVLFSSLGGIALYLFAGQYATNTALADLDEASKTVAGDTASAAVLSQHLISDTGNAPTPVSVSVFRNGNWQPLIGVTPDSLARPNEPVPTWLLHTFRGIIERDGRLYLCAANTADTPQGPAEIFGSRPLDEPTLGSLDRGFGVLRIFSHNEAEVPDNDEDGTPKARARHTTNQVALKGGSLPPAASLIDAPISFGAPIPIYAWNTGEQVTSGIVVVSRPTILYHRLFANSFSGEVARIVLLTVIIAFVVLELFAVLMAIAVSRTIVGSVAALYRGTRAIDAGNLEHRVPVRRQDQLGELAGSFNRMARSIADLLIQQREKDRLLNELSIAQEVQRTLFPQSPTSGAGLELHAVCVPALTVGGDYYDFIFGPQNAVCLTLGDISGKGMSAALLMASLHSSIRALSFDSAGGAAISPAAIMETINRSLYRSTQLSRYATLFAACYEAETRALTYSNGGHLPPIILTAAGAVERLEVGGPVVGLLPGMAYSEATVQLHRGDLLIAFTDGVTEPEQGTQEFGEQRLIDLIQPIKTSPLPVIMATVLAAVKQWIGDHEQPDDITLLLARQL
jgi:sigma-B regulation protein RsbU (phosphoserine phosphatase)